MESKDQDQSNDEISVIERMDAQYSSDVEVLYVDRLFFFLKKQKIGDQESAQSKEHANAESGEIGPAGRPVRIPSEQKWIESELSH